ncbi:RagB/SusD family nutrient uptake outer membrane protein [uncultured Pontibacter sp.]|uniref:RagB/SusD family nutrient uptake outer membrane protein n=1 Tax=uncultured Pontibacter sp. TaxID=453356 RepID=UPI0026213942|nr:RagB/SusD family nutrient uptake outer membrane protein [uncultured Pontibacter sp.]
MRTNKLSKFILSALLVGGMSFSVSSCKDYLEVEPVSLFGPDYIFSNVSSVQKQVLGIYSTLAGDNGYGIRLSMYYTLDDDLMMGQGATPFPDNERRDIAHYTVQPSNTQLANPFKQLYQGVERANLAIYYIPKMEMYTSGTEAQKKELRRLHGEALTLRAQLYLELIRNWGDVPGRFLPADLVTESFLGRTDRDEIYDQLLADLAEAATLVPWRGELSARDERITQGAVRALRARIALFRGGYSLRLNRQMERPANYQEFYKIARDESKAIIDRNDHRLNPSYEAVFKEAIAAGRIEPNGEVIWEVAMAGGSSALGDSKLGYYNGPRLNGSTGNGALTILPTYFYSFDQSDLRRDVTAAPYNISSAAIIQPRSLQTMVDGKFRRDWIPGMMTSNAQYFGLNWPLIRYSDVLLMFAEAENELSGPTADAYEAVNQVRRRAFGKPIFTADAAVDLSAGLGKLDFFNAIVQERAWEFGGEGIRKYDLIRWNMLGQRLSETKAELAAMAAQQVPYQNLPSTMYFNTKATQVEWLNSLYAPVPNPAPSGADISSVPWVGSGITNTILTYYAVGFTPNKSELMPLHTTIVDANPNLKQEYGY